MWIKVNRVEVWFMGWMLLLSPMVALRIQSIRGGHVPQANSTNSDYFEMFQLDYGTDDKIRMAGSLRGMIKSGNIRSLPESDPFFKWLNEHLEVGIEPIQDRLKPFYAADFGSKKDLKSNENPKLVIVQRKLSSTINGTLTSPPDNIDVEIREIREPWLKRKCDFVVRYIVPNRINILKIMEAKGQFLSEVEVKEDPTTQKQTAFAKMTFRPTLWQRCLGKKNIVIRRPLPDIVLKDSKVNKNYKYVVRDDRFDAIITSVKNIGTDILSIALGGTAM